MDDAYARFWDKYLSKLIAYNVPVRERQWYVRRVEGFIEAQSGRKLAVLYAHGMRAYLNEKYRSKTLPDWQYKQLLNALRILFVDMIRPDWSNEFDWSLPVEMTEAVSDVVVNIAATADHPGNVQVNVKASEKGVVARAAGIFPTVLVY